MSCCCRESLSPIKMIPINYKIMKSNKFYTTKYFIKDCKRLLHPKNLLDKLWWEDTFGPLVCKVVGHDPYLTDEINCNEIACKRCHTFI